MTKATFVNFFYWSYQVLLTCCYYTQVSYTGSWEPLVSVNITVNPVTGNDVILLVNITVNPVAGDDVILLVNITVNPVTGNDVILSVNITVNPVTGNDVILSVNITVNPVSGNDVILSVNITVNPVTGNDVILSKYHCALYIWIFCVLGLILVDEPYYNEAGYEKHRGTQQGAENSQMYNEMAIIKLVEVNILYSYCFIY